jgi:hypothetical protein
MVGRMGAWVGGAIRQIRDAFKSRATPIPSVVRNEQDGSLDMARGDGVDPQMDRMDRMERMGLEVYFGELDRRLEINRGMRMAGRRRNMDRLDSLPFRLHLASLERARLPVILETLSPNSSYILKMFWTASRSQMRVDFYKKDRGVLYASYEYFGVEERDWQKLVDAPSKGTYFYKNMRLVFHYILVYHSKPDKYRAWTPEVNKWGIDV